MVALEVMISTIGPDALSRLDLCHYPVADGVIYTIGWQEAGKNPSVPSIFSLRNDIRILFSPSSGLSVNRNFLLSHAIAPLLLVSDDDVRYESNDLYKIIRIFKERTECSLMAFRQYQDDGNRGGKYYPDHEFSLGDMPKGYYVSSIELAFRRADVVGKVAFDERFGLGARFPFGEEEIFVNRCVRVRLNCSYIPMEIVTHDGTRAGDKERNVLNYAETKGAVFSVLYPHSWIFRMLVHAWRQFPFLPLSAIRYCIAWHRGNKLSSM